MENLIKYRQNIKKNYLFVFLKSMDFTHGIWMIYLYSKGLSLIELGFLESIFHITSFLMETPTGAIADLYGRKMSRILGRLSSIVAILFMLLSQSMVGFVIGFIFTGLSYNLESGADSAFVYDNLRHLGEEKRNMEVNGLNEVLYQIASSIGLLIAGFVAVINIEATYLLNLAMVFLSLAVLLMMKETTIQKVSHGPVNVFTAIKNQYKTTAFVIKNEKKVFFFVMFLNVTGALLTTAFFYQQNFWKSIGYTEAHIGVFLAIHSIFASLGGYFAHRIEKRFTSRFILRVLPVIFVFLLFFLGFRRLSIVSMALLGVIDSLNFVVLNDYIHRLIPSEQRATIMSFSSMMFSTSMILIFPFFGFFAERFDFNIAFLVLAITGLLLLVMYLLIYKGDSNEKA